MSWLLAACVPGLLMLATFGLEKLEAGIATNSSDDDLTELIELAGARTEPARRGEPVVPTVPPLRNTFNSLDDEPGLPTRRYVRRGPNTQFQPSPAANRV